MNSFNDIWNYPYIQKQAQQRFHNQQVFQVSDAVKKLKDFLDSTDRVASEYQDVLTTECCAVLLDYAYKHNFM